MADSTVQALEALDSLSKGSHAGDMVYAQQILETSAGYVQSLAMKSVDSDIKPGSIESLVGMEVKAGYTALQQALKDTNQFLKQAVFPEDGPALYTFADAVVARFFESRRK